MRGMIPHIKYTLTVGGFLKLVYWIGLADAVRVFARDLIAALRAWCDT